ncbi:MAG: glycosyltransferase [Candidatus Coproplasma sp.]
MSLSVCMIVRDEEETLPRCLDCVKKFADQIVIVDTGSTDNTVIIAEDYGAEVYFFAWRDDFSAARNFSFSKAECDYIMWLDADDVVEDEDCIKINLLKERGGFDVAFLKYVSCGGAFVYYRERILRRAKNFLWQGMVHEAITPDGTIIYSDAKISHEKVKENPPLRNLSIYQKAIARGICLNEREKFYYGRELYFNKMYRESAAVLTDFLQGGGWVENKIEACRTIFSARQKLGDGEGALSALLRAFTYAAPKCEDCCTLGAYFFEKGDFPSAIFWYKSALVSPEKEEDGGFVNLDYREFVPCIQLCVLYDRMGDFKTASEFNERAGKVKPYDKSYLSNRQYFKNKLNEENF